MSWFQLLNLYLHLKQHADETSEQGKVTMKAHTIYLQVPTWVSSSASVSSEGEIPKVACIGRQPVSLPASELKIDTWMKDIDLPL